MNQFLKNERMERRIGEVINYHGHKLVVEILDPCAGCYFNGKKSCGRKECGTCNALDRSDGQSVVFKEYKTNKTE